MTVGIVQCHAAAAIVRWYGLAWRGHSQCWRGLGIHPVPVVFGVEQARVANQLGRRHTRDDEAAQLPPALRHTGSGPAALIDRHHQQQAVFEPLGIGQSQRRRHGPVARDDRTLHGLPAHGVARDIQSDQTLLPRGLDPVDDELVALGVGVGPQTPVWHFHRQSPRARLGQPVVHGRGRHAAREGQTTGGRIPLGQLQRPHELARVAPTGARMGVQPGTRGQQEGAIAFEGTVQPPLGQVHLVLQLLLQIVLRALVQPCGDGRGQHPHQQHGQDRHPGGTALHRLPRQPLRRVGVRSALHRQPLLLNAAGSQPRVTAPRAPARPRAARHRAAWPRSHRPPHRAGGAGPRASRTR